VTSWAKCKTTTAALLEWATKLSSVLIGMTDQPHICNAWVCSGLRAVSGSSQRAKGAQKVWDFTLVTSC
jgi:hypothetical protein